MCLQGEEGGGTGEQCPGRKGSEQVEPDPEQSLVSRGGGVSTRQPLFPEGVLALQGWLGPGRREEGEMRMPPPPCPSPEPPPGEVRHQEGESAGRSLLPRPAPQDSPEDWGVGGEAHDRRLGAGPRGQWEQVHAGKWWPGSRHIPGGPGPTLGPPVWVTLRINTLL